mgnify:CR=1 FL=1
MGLQLFNTEYLTIDIGFKFTKVLKVKKQKNDTLFVMRYGITETPKGCIKNGAIQDKERVISVIKKLIEENNLLAREAKIVMSGTNIISRIITVDKADENVSRKKVMDEIKKEIPINFDEHSVDYKVIDVLKEEGISKARVFVIAVSRTIIASYIDIIKGLGLRPLAVDIPSNSAAKFFHNEVVSFKQGDINYKKGKIQSGSDSETVAVIDLGSETTIVNILKNKIIEFNRVLLVGSSNIDMSVAKSLNMETHNLEPAERLKKMYGIVGSNGTANEIEQKCVNAAKTVINETIRNVKMCFDFYTNKCEGDNIKRVYLVGGGSNLKGIKAYFEQLFEIPAYTINELHISGIEFAPGLDTDKMTYFINALGVAV